MRYDPEMPDVDWIRRLCLSLPGATENIQWGEDLCFKVRGRIFTTVCLSDGRFPSVCFKCSPEKFDELRELEGAGPAPYVGRYKWILLSRSNLLPSPELENLIRESYSMVAAKAPKQGHSKKGFRRRSRR